jgi:hypothetical protein
MYVGMEGGDGLLNHHQGCFKGPVLTNLPKKPFFFFAHLSGNQKGCVGNSGIL